MSEAYSGDDRDDVAADDDVKDVVKRIAEDPEGYAEAEVLRQTLEQRAMWPKKVRESKDFVSEGWIDQEGANSILRTTLEEYIVQLESLEVGDDDSELWDKYAHEVELGSVVVPRPDGTEERPVGYNFVGLMDILERPDPLFYDYTVKQEPPASTMGSHPDGESKTVRVETQIDENVLRNGFRAANMYLSGIGLGVTVDDSDKEYRYEYSDLVDGDEDE